MRKYENVTLVDGTIVDSGSEAWRFECEARAVLNMPSKVARLDYLNGFQKMDGRKEPGVLGRRGVEARDQLQAMVLTLWQARQSRQAVA